MLTASPTKERKMAKYSVCYVCRGEGYVGTLGAYTSDEFGQAFEDFDSYSELHEMSKAPCELCKGRRVVTPDELKEWDEMVELRAMEAAERRFGC